MDIFKSLAGMLTVELVSADLAGAFRDINGMGIPAYDIRFDDILTARFRIDRGNYRKLSGYAAAKGMNLHIAGKQGLFWKAKRLLRRPVLVTGMLLLLLLAVLLPGRILFIQVEGNSKIPDRQILAAAGECGITFGTSGREVRSERMKNALLQRLPELQWAGVNTYGCLAVISVRERPETEEEGESGGVSSIVADRDGLILSATVTSGNGVCRPGQAVRAGETLISGFNDCGLCVTATRAEGEIIARTSRELHAVTPSERLGRTAEQGSRRRFCFIIGKKRINLYNGSGISDTGCVKMYSEYVLTLPGGFSLPVSLICEQIRSFESEPAPVPEPEAAALLCAFANRCLLRRMVAGSILDADTSVTASDGLWNLSGKYACTENIGTRRQEQIGELHETN